MGESNLAPLDLNQILVDAMIKAYEKMDVVLGNSYDEQIWKHKFLEDNPL